MSSARSLFLDPNLIVQYHILQYSTEASVWRARHRVFRRQKPWQENFNSQFRNNDQALILSFSDELPATSARPSLGAGRAEQWMVATLVRRNTINTCQDLSDGYLGHEMTSSSPPPCIFEEASRFPQCQYSHGTGQCRHYWCTG